MFRSVRTRERKRRLGLLHHRWVAIAVVAVMAVASAGGYGAWLYFSTQGRIQDEALEGDVRPQEHRMAPFTALLVGSDSRAGLTEEEKERLAAGDIQEDGTPVTGERADTLILARVHPETNKVIMVQFPRDLYVPTPNGDRRKINSMLLDGRVSLVRTVEELTGLEINHYAQVNIAGFKDLVDAIGGVRICIPEPIPFDEGTGIEVPPEEVGLVEFDGERALRFVRARKVFATGDFERMQNQQRFLAAAIDKVTSVGTLLRLGTIKRLFDIAGDNFHTDPHTTIKGLYDIGRRFRQFDPENYEAYIVPILGDETDEEAGYIINPDLETMEVMFEAMGNNESPAAADNAPDVDPSAVRVGVYNGTGRAGVATRAARRLRQATMVDGRTIRVVETGNADRFNYRRTKIFYEPGGETEKMAELMAAALPDADLVEKDTKLGIDVEVVVGRRFEVKRVIQLVPIPLPTPGDLPEACR